jgi:hypothetical protein
MNLLFKPAQIVKDCQHATLCHACTMPIRIGQRLLPFEVVGRLRGSIHPGCRKLLAAVLDDDGPDQPAWVHYCRRVARVLSAFPQSGAA